MTQYIRDAGNLRYNPKTLQAVMHYQYLGNLDQPSRMILYMAYHITWLILFSYRENTKLSQWCS